MKHADRERPPRWVWRLTVGGLAVVLALTGIAAAWIAIGLTDPPTAGPFTWQDRAFDWAGGPTVALIPAQETWLDAPAAAALRHPVFTLSVRARLDAESDPSAAWGVWLAEADGARVIYALSGEGYTTTRRCPAAPWPPDALEDCPALRPDWRWMPYNRIQPPGRANTITLHVEPDGAIRLRINDERLGAHPVTTAGAWGVWTRGGRDSGAALTWELANVRSAISE